jgi:hypothetical protein
MAPRMGCWWGWSCPSARCWVRIHLGVGLVPGVAALVQYKAREGHLTVPRGHVEALPDGNSPTSGWCGQQEVKERGKLVDKFWLGIE